MSSGEREPETIAWRTRLVPGAQESYSRIHSRIPEPIAAALRDAGVIEWRIWRDGLTLFHLITTTDGRDAMGRRMDALGPIDPQWDALIATMVDAVDGSSALLPLVWGMDAGHQFSAPV
jgi:L-rhamnose mutarotase